jgi:hypothetical protein
MKTCELCFIELEEDEVYSSLEHDVLCYDCQQEQEDLLDLGVLLDEF